MLDIKMIRENPEKVNELLKRRNPELSIDEVLEIDVERRKIQTQVDELRAKRKNDSQKIGLMKKNGENTAHFFRKQHADDMQLILNGLGQFFEIRVKKIFLFIGIRSAEHHPPRFIPAVRLILMFPVFRRQCSLSFPPGLRLQFSLRQNCEGSRFRHIRKRRARTPLPHTRAPRCHPAAPQAALPSH